MLNEYRRLEEKRKLNGRLNKHEDFRYKDLRDTLDRHFQQGEKPAPLTPPQSQSYTKSKEPSPTWGAKASPRQRFALQELFILEQSRRLRGLAPSENTRFTELMDEVFSWYPSSLASLSKQQISPHQSSPQWEAAQRHSQSPPNDSHLKQTLRTTQGFHLPPEFSTSSTDSVSAYSSVEEDTSSPWQEHSPGYDVDTMSDEYFHPPESLELPASGGTSHESPNNSEQKPKKKLSTNH